MRLRFGNCIVDTDRRTLSRSGENVSLEPRSFDLLEYLAKQEGRAVAKDELIANVWDGRAVSDAAITTCIRSVRKAIDTVDAPSTIKTLPRVGYRFEADVELSNTNKTVRSDDIPVVADVSRGNGLPMKPSIAVIPFEDLSVQKDQNHFVQGLTENLVTALSQFKELSVAGQSSYHALRDLGFTIPELGARLGVRYLLKGSVRWAGSKMRISAQMIEAATEKHIWARNYDREGDDVLGIQDEVTRSITCVLLSSIVVSEQRRIEHRPLESLDAWECYHRAYKLYESPDLTKKRQALRIWERSIELDKNFIEGSALLIRATAIYCALCGPTSEREALIARASEVANHALHVDPHHDLLWAACVNLYAHLGETGKAMKAADKALDLNPQGQHSIYANGLAHFMSGQYDRSVSFYQQLLDMGQDITIRHPAMSICAAAMVNLGRFDDAIELCQSAQLEPNADFRAFVPHISALGHLSLPEEAAKVIASGKRLEPSLGFKYLSHCHPLNSRGQESRLHDGLSMAGFPI